MSIRRDIKEIKSDLEVIGVQLTGEKLNQEINTMIEFQNIEQVIDETDKLINILARAVRKIEENASWIQDCSKNISNYSEIQMLVDFIQQTSNEAFDDYIKYRFGKIDN